jgi:hypothetical protein
MNKKDLQSIKMIYENLYEPAFKETDEGEFEGDPDLRFAVYKERDHVVVLEIDEDEALVQFKDGHEARVPVATIDYID